MHRCDYCRGRVSVGYHLQNLLVLCTRCWDEYQLEDPEAHLNPLVDILVSDSESESSTDAEMLRGQFYDAGTILGDIEIAHYIG